MSKAVAQHLSYVVDCSAESHWFFLRIGLNPDEAIAKTVEYDVAVALCWFGLPVKPRKSCIETASLPVVIHHYVFAGCQCLGVEILNSDTIGGWFVSCIERKLARRHCAHSRWLASLWKSISALTGRFF